ncbi:M20 family metallo-hydrolase [uncultured Agrococcus sp.]|uniref:M20 family metallo-hydrolase n=1 Tax=uncultured Agrococcus sp. TaxID=382258 RepID=UPI0025FBBC87|nr:M20 family metallo-hydrolase [uncultured Agrococcus sp.]
MNSNDTDFLADWEQLSQIGRVEGTLGVDREAASAADGEQRRWFAELLRSRGFTVHRDEIGNLFGLLELVPGAPYVLTGSHLDSQPTAGRFDGAYGVLASAYACFRLADRLRNEAAPPVRNLAVVNWFNEEGSRFKPSLMGSGVFTGKLSLAEALETRDKKGTSVRAALDALEERGNFAALNVASYAEIHVQQGRSMEEGGIAIGLVDATWGARKYELRVRGEQSHSGSTLMTDRRDALLAAARLIVAARELVDEFPPGALHSACGEIQVYPNSPVVVASEASVLIDFRSENTEFLQEAARRFLTIAAEIAEQDRVEVEIAAEHSWERNPYTPQGVELARAVAQELGVTHDTVMTVAGHDSTNMKDVVPTVMLFVPSVEGRSHSVRELTSDADMLAGVRMLTEVVHRLASSQDL